MRLTTAQALVRFLAVQYSERDGVRRRVIPELWGILGHGNVCGLGEAVAGGALPFRSPYNEQAMVHTALGYAKATRRLATLACTSSIGPGATNLVTGAATATTNRLPVLLLPADTFANRRQGPVLQQLEHPSYADWSVNECLRPVSRFFDRVARPEQLLTALPEALRVLLDPSETGAVTVALHQDVQGEAYEFPPSFFVERVWRVPRAPAEPGVVAEAASLLRRARRPLIVAGGGVWHSGAEQALAALADGAGVPVAETSAGKGVYTGPLALGGIGVNGTRAANAIAAAADVVVCVGTRLSDFTTASHSLFQAPDVRFVAINVCAADAAKLGALPVVADALSGLSALATSLRGWRAPEEHAAAARTAVAAWDEEVDAALAAGRALDQGVALRVLEAAVRAGDWVVAAAGSPPGDLLKLWRPVPGSHAHIEFAFSCMGHELPAGLGIRLADPDAGEVLVVIGDGTYLLATSELATAVQQRLKITVVLLVNGGYRSIQALQHATVGEAAGTEFPQPAVDFAANAASYGWRVWTATDTGALAASLGEARDAARPAIIVVPVAQAALPSSGAFWDLGVAQVSERAAARAAAADQARGRALQRFFG